MTLANFINFIYGDCEPSGDTGCAPPLQVQVWPACTRNLSTYSSGGEPKPHEHLTLRGVPAALFVEQERLELYTGDVTIVIFGFGFDREQFMQAANAVRGVNNDIDAMEQLPTPTVGALEGTLACEN